jgi:hypothetical protein
MVDSLKIWNDCVQAAKGTTGECSYQIIRGNVLKRAQKAYLAIMLGNKNFKNGK